MKHSGINIHCPSPSAGSLKCKWEGFTVFQWNQSVIQGDLVRHFFETKWVSQLYI